MQTYQWTNNKEDLKAWDAFLFDNERGHYLQISHWLATYKSYGFDYEYLIVKDTNDRIIGGMGVVTGGPLLFKICIAPCAPIILPEHEFIFEEILNRFLKKAKEKKAFYCHMNAPILEVDHPIVRHSCLNTIKKDSQYYSGKEGIKFRYISTVSGFRVVDLHQGHENAFEEVRANFRPKTRRDVNRSQRMNNELKFAKTPETIEKAYRVIEQNAYDKGFAVRSWLDIKETLIAMVNDGYCVIPCCYNDNDLKGALILFETGKKVHSIMGGVRREKKNLQVGQFLQNATIEYALGKGYRFYDISVGGTESVTKFKEGFGSNLIKFKSPRHWILSSSRYKIYGYLLPIIAKNKVLVSKILKLFR